MVRPEVNINPWDDILVAIKGKAELIKWKDREPYAFWKGNYGLAETRRDLFRCNDHSRTDWKARVYAQVISYLHMTMIFDSSAYFTTVHMIDFRRRKVNT